MAIIFSCAGCGSRMQAPETLAGQKARCPSCQLVLDVPEPILEAEPTPAYPPPRPPSVPPLPLGITPQVFSPVRAEPEPAEEQRRPCPMCGEMIVAGAAKCRFCGEVFDPALKRRFGSREDEKTFRKLANGVGGLWIFFGCLCLLAALAGIITTSDKGATEEDVALIVGFIIVALCWLAFGICTCLKQMWAVYAGLIFSYLNLIFALIGLVGALAGPGGGGSASFGIFGFCMLIAGIVQAHKVINLSGKAGRGRRF